MVLPSKEIVQDIRNLIGEITGFGEEEENFYICEQYCLSHVMHHSYPSVNKNEVKKLIDGYVLRFFIHGHFKVADGLDAEVKNFLSCDTLFKKNPESDIQWSLLSLLTSLASNLSSVTKLPKKVPLIEEEKPVEEINWAEYLKEDLPIYQYHHSDEDSFRNSKVVFGPFGPTCVMPIKIKRKPTNSKSDQSYLSESSESFVDCEERITEEIDLKTEEKTEEFERKEVSSLKKFQPSRQHIIDDLVKRREKEIGYARDIVLRGNLLEDIGLFTNSRLSWRTSQILSEFELVGFVLMQLLTGENIFKRKGITNPVTCSLTEGTVRNYLSLIQPYVDMMKVFKEFSNEVSSFDGVEETEEQTRGKYYKTSSIHTDLYKIKQSRKEAVPNVVKLYDLALREALNLYENQILKMSEYQNSYTLVKILHELRPSFSDLNSLYAIHLSATANWLNEPNWLCSVRIIMTLYKAVLLSTSNRMGFLYMNMFLYCFQAYLDITDRWISCRYLNDPNDEFIIFRTVDLSEIGSGKYTYSVRPYKEELSRIGLKEIEILEYLEDKMIQVGHSIDVLHRLDHSVIKEAKESNLRRESSYEKLLSSLKVELKSLKSEVGGIIDGDNNNNNNNNIRSNNSGGDNSEPDRDRCTSAETLDISACKQIALNEFCAELCENDEMEHVENSIWPLCAKMDMNIKNVINWRVLNTCDIVKGIVLNEFKLKDHLTLVRCVYLFNESHIIQPFTNAMFNQELPWRNRYALTPQLRECIETRCGDLAQNFSVTVEGDSSRPPENVLEAINGITINYQVKWPLQLMFSPRIMKLYNEIFRNLLKIHWAHETLCKLQFKDKGEKVTETAKSPNRRLELLRFWCLSSLARLRSYFMTQISMPFDLETNNFRHFKHIIDDHEVFVKKMHSRCLLDEEKAEGRELIFNVLIPLCHDVYQFWSSGRTTPTAKLEYIENLFFTSHKQFSKLMAGLEEK